MGDVMYYFIEETKKAPNGIVYPFHSHEQKLVGHSVMANAHIHNYIEILYCLSGEMDVFLNTKCIKFKTGDLIIINSKEVHKVVTLSEGMNKYIVVKFVPELLYTTPQTIFEAKYVLPFTFGSSTHQKLFQKDEIQQTFVPELVKEILHEFVHQNYGFELSIRANICKLFLWILRRWNEQGVDLNIDYNINESVMKRLQIAFEYIESNYQSNITVEEIARLCNMSYSYFSRFFKSIMKRNFSEYLNSVRITAAEKLLATTDLSITEVAMEVGFSTSSYFTYQFKRHRNILPLQYRKMISKKAAL